LLATSFGRAAVDVIASKEYNRLVVWRNGEVQTEPLDKVIRLVRKCHQENRCPSPVNPNGFMVQTAQSLGIYVGDLTPSVNGGAESKTDAPSLLLEPVPQ
jgi:6-phosphofructokinase 1